MKIRNTVLIVDDMEVNRAILSGLFEKEYYILEAENGVEAISLLEKHSESIVVMLLDIVMPEKDGYQVLQEMNYKGMLSKIPVIVITSEASSENEMLAFDYGASDIITKPFEPHLVERRVINIVELYKHKLHLEELVEEQALRLRESNEVITDALSTVIEYRSLESGQHILRIRMFTKLLLQKTAQRYPDYHLTPEKIDVISRASAMHDIGKIAIPDSILNKPGKLTEEEFKIMKGHSLKGAALLEVLQHMDDQQYLYYAYNICRYHHERWDGRGYPDGLKGENIPISAQVVSIADAYDALTTDRVYKKAFSHEKAASMIINGECGIFSPKLIKCFQEVSHSFERLAKEYADGRSPRSDFLTNNGEKKNIVFQNSLSMTASTLDIQKYYALLNYVDATVIEIDWDLDTQEMISSNSSDFEILRKNGSFYRNFQIFVNHCVYAKEQYFVLESLKTGLKEIFENGMGKYSYEFQVLSHSGEDYIWYENTILRIDTGNPNQHKVLLILSNINDKKQTKQKIDNESYRLIQALKSCYLAIYQNNITNNTYSVIRTLNNMLNYSQYPPSYTEAIIEEANQMIHPDDRQRFLKEYDLEHMKSYFSNHYQRIIYIRHKVDNDTYRWVETHCIRACNTNSNELIVYSFLFVVDNAHFPPALNNIFADTPIPEQTKEEQTLELETLANYIPGGMFSCLFDQPLTLLQMNEGFLSMFGYTRQEIKDIFHNSFLNMVDPRDRERTLDEIIHQTTMGNSKILEYRVRCKNGAIVWVLDKGTKITSQNGMDYFYCILIDITSTKQTQEELRLSLERHKIVMDQTNDIVVEWDMEQDTLIYSANWEKKFGYTPISENLSKDLTNSHVHPEDQKIFSDALESLKNNKKKYIEVELRLKKTTISYIWCRMRFTVQYNDSQKPIKAVGVIIDIDTSKRQTQKLLEIAQKDTLTKLYNKGSAEKLVSEHLKHKSPNTFSAILMIDVDNFKQVNDTMGHMFGDTLLVAFSDHIKKIFRSMDIVGRIGGDEFIVCMKDIIDINIALEKANQIITNCHQLLPASQYANILSCSIGVAIAPLHGQMLHTLYQNADIALYQAKKLGKGRFVLYTNTLQKIPSQCPEGYNTAIGGQIDSNKRIDEGKNRLAENLFQKLVTCDNLNIAINSVLSEIGAYFDVSRVYIFENIENKPLCKNTFEWCGAGIHPQKDKFQLLPYHYGTGAHYMEYFDEYGIFNCNTIEMLTPNNHSLLNRKDVKSMLQCALYDNGLIRGFIGFDECRINRVWNQEQIDTLLMLSKILTLFLHKINKWDNPADKPLYVNELPMLQKESKDD